MKATTRQYFSFVTELHFSTLVCPVNLSYPIMSECSVREEKDASGRCKEHSIMYFSEDANKSVRFHPSCSVCVNENPGRSDGIRCDSNYFRCPEHPWSRASWAASKPAQKKKKIISDQKNKLI